MAQLQGNNRQATKGGEESSGLVLSFGAAQDGGRANKRERKAEEGGLRIMKGSRNLVEAPDG